MTEHLIASANTVNGLAIGIVRRGSRYLVVRMNDQSRYVILDKATTEADARKVANREWASDMGHPAAYASAAR